MKLIQNIIRYRNDIVACSEVVIALRKIIKKNSTKEEILKDLDELIDKLLS